MLVGITNWPENLPLPVGKVGSAGENRGILSGRGHPSKELPNFWAGKIDKKTYDALLRKGGSTA